MDRGGEWGRVEVGLIYRKYVRIKWGQAKCVRLRTRGQTNKQTKKKNK